jgi:hypothetical protein
VIPLECGTNLFVTVRLVVTRVIRRPVVLLGVANICVTLGEFLLAFAVIAEPPGAKFTDHLDRITSHCHNHSAANTPSIPAMQRMVIVRLVSLSFLCVLIFINFNRRRSLELLGSPPVNPRRIGRIPSCLFHTDKR